MYKRISLRVPWALARWLSIIYLRHECRGTSTMSFSSLVIHHIPTTCTKESLSQNHELQLVGYPSHTYDMNVVVQVPWASARWLSITHLRHKCRGTSTVRQVSHHPNVKIFLPFPLGKGSGDRFFIAPKKQTNHIFKKGAFHIMQVDLIFLSNAKQRTGDTHVVKIELVWFHQSLYYDRVDSDRGSRNSPK